MGSAGVGHHRFAYREQFDTIVHRHNFWFA
jgi:hypothetical protein